MTKDKEGLFLIVAGISGSGKTFLIHQLTTSLQFVYIPSITTRPPRNNEINGINRIFYTLDEFHKLKKEGKFLFETQMFGHWYAHSKELLDQHKTGHNIVCELRYNFIAEAKTIFPKARSIYLWPDTLDHAIAVLKQRGACEAELKKRIEDSYNEVLVMRSFEQTNSNAVDVYFINGYTHTDVEKFRAVAAEFLLLLS